MCKSVLGILIFIYSTTQLRAEWASQIKQALDLGQDREQMSGAGLGAGMLEDTGAERHSVASTDQAEFLEQDASIQRQDQRVLAPLT
ncbi:hypothetical protein GCM10022631_14160 [Deinococcus rubellus]